MTGTEAKSADLAAGKLAIPRLNSTSASAHIFLTGSSEFP